MAIERYRWSGGEEHILRFGQQHALQILVLQPFFEEANRLRHILVEAMRRLEELGIGTALPDLPGAGESLIDTDAVDLPDWRNAALAAASHVNAQITASFRGAALIDDACKTRFMWRCAPESGQRLVRDLMRTRLTSGEDSDKGPVLSLAGNRVRKTLIDALGIATPASIGQIRTVRLQSDQAEADGKIEGSPVWRRSEPGDDPALLQSIVSDLSEWARQCAG